MSKEIFMQNFVSIQRDLRELDNLAFVAMVTNLTWKQRKEQPQLRSLDPHIKPGLHSTHDAWIIYNYVMKMPPLYPRTSCSNNKSRYLNKGHWRKIRGIQVVTDKCWPCRQFTETVEQWFAEYQILARTDNLKRHNKALSIVAVKRGSKRT